MRGACVLGGLRRHVLPCPVVLHVIDAIWAVDDQPQAAALANPSGEP